MATELPHALLTCADCGAGFKLTLKKGRLPSQAVPCPQCKTPVIVKEEHVVAPGSKPAGEVLGGNLRETKPGDVLEEARAQAHNAASADPPTAEVSLDGLSSDVEDEPEDEDAAPAFGIVHRKRTRSAKPTPTKQALAKNLGVEVVTNTGHRDNVYGQLKSGAHALARIGARPSTVTPVHLEADNADLPALSNGASHEEVQPEKISKLDKLRAAKASRELAAVARIDPSEVGEPSELELAADAVSEQSEVSEPSEIGEPSEVSEPSEIGEPSEVSEPSEIGEPSEVSEPSEIGEPSEVSEPSEISEPGASEPSEPELELGEAAAPVQSEPDVVMLDVEDSEGYELGDVEIPSRAEPSRRDMGGIIVGVVLLIVIGAAVFFAFS